MGLVETEAFVLRTYRLAEADKIVVLLTRTAGLVRGVARGARKLKSRFGAGLEPFTLGSVIYYEKEGRELVSIRQVEIARSYFHLAREVETVALLDYLGELLLEFTPPHDPNEKLFRMIKACLDAIAETRAEADEVARYFEIWLLKLSGFLPDARVCAACHRQLQGPACLSSGSNIQCEACAQGLGLRLSTEARTRLRAAQGTAPSAWARQGRDASQETRQELAQLTRQLILRALERAPRSQPVEA